MAKEISPAAKKAAARIEAGRVTPQKLAPVVIKLPTHVSRGRAKGQDVVARDRLKHHGK